MEHLDDDDAWADADIDAERYARFVREGTGGGRGAIVGETTDNADLSLQVLVGTAPADMAGSAGSDEGNDVGTDDVMDSENVTSTLVATPASSSTLHLSQEEAPSFVSPLPPMISTVRAGPASPSVHHDESEVDRQRIDGGQASIEQQEENKEGVGPSDEVQGSDFGQLGLVNETIIEEDAEDAEDTDDDNGDADESVDRDLSSPLVTRSGHSDTVGDAKANADADADMAYREGSLQDIDLSPSPSPLHEVNGAGRLDRSRSRTVGPPDTLQSPNQISYRRAGGDDPPAPIRFGTFINKHILRARRLFKRGSRAKDADGGGIIAGTVKFDPATGSLLPTSGDAGASTMHASDLRRRKSRIRQYCERTEYGRSILRSTLTVMHFLGRLLLWTSIIAMVVMIIYYSHELKQNGTDPHLIAWFSAGAFVLLGFPISIYGIFTHLSNYYQPHIQCYVVRILWMVPIYSIESWLCLRFHTYAIYIETLRDCYESFVLYSFFQFLIQVLGGEEQLVLMLKDKSPTRGVHIWGFDWCIKPWLMGQPVSRTYVVAQSDLGEDATAAQSTTAKGGGGGPKAPRTIKQVRWTSPFLVKCKRGILQYVVLKFVCSVSAMLLEVLGWYHEGSFSPKYGYFYICLLTNFSQCWALYCLVFFYYATKNELGPIRPVGKFLSVKALVFFTWWQSVGISILFQMGMIPHYSFADSDGDGSGEDSNLDWTAEDVAKGLQDYLICIEMFGAAILHTFVFPHTDYLQPIGIAGTPTQRAYSSHIPGGMPRTGKRLGRKGKVFWNGTAYTVHRDDRSVCSKSSSIAPDQFDLELGPVPPSSAFAPSVAVMDDGEENNAKRIALSSDEEDDAIPRRASTGNISQIRVAEQDRAGEENGGGHGPLSSAPVSGSSGMASYSQHSAPPQQHPTQPKGFVHAFLDSTLPKDVLDESVGYLRGNMAVEKKTLLSHAATSDEYDLFSKSPSRRKPSMAASMGRSRRATPNKTIFPKNIGYPGVPVMKSVKEQD